MKAPAATSGRGRRAAVVTVVAVASVFALLGLRGARGPGRGADGAHAASRVADDAPRTDAPIPERPPPTEGAAAAPDEIAPPNARALPSSLAGTAVDGELQADAAGHLIVSRRTKLFFDYFLVATGEESDADIRARVSSAARARVPEAAAREAMELYDRYAHFRAGAQRLTVRDDAGYEARVASVRALRREHLGEARARAFFAGDEELEDELLRQRARGASPASAAREQGSAATIARLDVGWRALPPDERRRARAAQLGDDAARRLEALDDEDAAWNRRVEAYRAERDALAHDPKYDVLTRALALDALRARDFTPQERVRIEALDRVQSNASTSGRTAN